MLGVFRGIIACLAFIGLGYQAQADDFTSCPWLFYASVCEDSAKTGEEWLGLLEPAQTWSLSPNPKPDSSRLRAPRYAYFDVVSWKYVQVAALLKGVGEFEVFPYVPTNRMGNEIMDMFFQDDMRERFPLLFSTSVNEQLETATRLELYKAVSAENPLELPNVELFARQVLAQVELKDFNVPESTGRCTSYLAIRKYKYMVDNSMPSFLQAVQCVSGPDVELVALLNCTNSDRLPSSTLGERDKPWESKGQEESGSIRRRLASINDFASSFPR